MVAVVRADHRRNELRLAGRAARQRLHTAHPCRRWQGRQELVVMVHGTLAPIFRGVDCAVARPARPPSDTAVTLFHREEKSHFATGRPSMFDDHDAW